MTYIDDRQVFETYLAGENSSEPIVDLAILSLRFSEQMLLLLDQSQTLVDNSAEVISGMSRDSTSDSIRNKLLAMDVYLKEYLADSTLAQPNSLQSLLTGIKTKTESILTSMNTGVQFSLLESIYDQLDSGQVLTIKNLLDDLKALVTTSNLKEIDLLSALDLILTELQAQSTKIYDVSLKADVGLNSTISNAIQDIRSLLLGLNANDIVRTSSIIVVNQVLVDSPVLRTLELAVEDQEYPLVLPIGTRRFSIKNRMNPGDANGIIRYAYAPGVVSLSGSSSEGYYTINTYVEDTEENINLTAPLTIYFASSTAGVKVTIEYWNPSAVTANAPASSVHLQNWIISNANTELLRTLPINTKKFTVKTVDPDPGDVIRLSYQPGVVATGLEVNGQGYTTIRSDGEYFVDSLGLSSALSIYLASNNPNVRVGLEYWT
jgi:hypothetical protein